MASQGARSNTAICGQRGTWAMLTAACALCLLIAPAPASAAGRKPSEAPLVAVGQHYFGNTANGRDGNASGSISNGSVDLWRLPPLLTADAINIAWHVVTNDVPGLCLAQNVDDYNWAQGGNQCNGSPEYRVAGNGNARTVIEAKTTTSDAFLEFFSGCIVDPGTGGEVDNCPYDFTIESIQHAIGVGLTPAVRIRPTSTLTGSANLSTGEPVPDGLAFTLTASWATPANRVRHHRRYRASSQAGRLTFRLSLPHSALHKRISLVVTRSADPDYLAAKSVRYSTRISGLDRALPSAVTSSTKQQCLPKLLQPPSAIKAVMLNPHRTEVLIKASFSGVEGCDSWQRIGKYRVQIKKPGGWADLEGDFWYPTDQDVADKNQAHKVAFLDFATHGVYEKCVKGHWEPARVRFINFVKSTVTGKLAARGKITDHPIKIEPSGTC